MTTPRALKLRASDNVAVCTCAVHPGDAVEIMHPDGSRTTTTAVSEIAYCNKIALCDIAEGEAVTKYGEMIGRATALIPTGSLANDANIASQPRAYADEYLLKE